VLDAFAPEYEGKIIYQTYSSPKEAAAQLRAGQKYDAMVL
jgi:spermidine/putrescine-binding protein